MNQAILTTGRLRLRPLVPEDAAAIAGLLGPDPQAVRMTARIPEPCTEEAARQWIALRAAPEGRVFAIERRADGTFLGVIGFGGPPERTGLGYWIGRPFWGRGYATEAARCVLAHARALGVTAVEAETFPENPASARVLAKLGFERRGLVIRDYPLRGGRREVHHHVLVFT